MLKINVVSFQIESFTNFSYVRISFTIEEFQKVIWNIQLILRLTGMKCEKKMLKKILQHIIKIAVFELSN